MLKSAENVGINMDDFIIACMDEDVYKSFILEGYKGSFLYMDNELKEYQDWTFDKNSGFRNIVRHKWKIIN
ncbi:MAG: putative nucleotide-diphospho-sugar transferase, partial [Candidatus Hodarchaeales archaeon]